MIKILALAALVVTAPAVVFAAGPLAAPEVDGGTAIAALTLLGGAVLVIRSRSRR